MSRVFSNVIGIFCNVFQRFPSRTVYNRRAAWHTIPAGDFSRGTRKGSNHMTPLFFRRGAALILACVITALWLTLPVYALPQMSAARTAERENTQDTVVSYSGEGSPREGSPVTDASNRTEQDPMHAIGQTPVRGGKWMAIALCALTAVSLLLIIAAMIPRKRK